MTKEKFEELKKLIVTSKISQENIMEEFKKWAEDLSEYPYFTDESKEEQNAKV